MTQRLDYQKLSTTGLRALGGVYTYIVNSGLPKALIDLVFLRASQIDSCEGRLLEEAGMNAAPGDARPWRSAPVRRPDCAPCRRR
jgi:hypothetical protein